MNGPGLSETSQTDPAEAAAKLRHKRAQGRGLLWLALLVVIAVLVRAARHGLLPPGWWKLW